LNPIKFSLLACTLALSTGVSAQAVDFFKEEGNELIAESCGIYGVFAEVAVQSRQAGVPLSWALSNP
jgi:hypothetical protein